MKKKKETKNRGMLKDQGVSGGRFRGEAHDGTMALLLEAEESGSGHFSEGVTKGKEKKKSEGKRKERAISKDR